MFEYLRLHFTFIFSRIVIFVLSLLILLSISSMVISSGIFDGRFMIDMYRKEYQLLFYMDSVLFIKITSIMMAIFISAIYNSESAINFSKYVIDHRTQKYAFFITKIITQLMLSFIYLVITLCSYVIVVKLFTPYSLDLNILVSTYTKIYLLAVFYIILTSLIMTCFPTVLITIFPLVLFWFMEVNATYDIIIASDSLEFLFKYVPHPFFKSNSLITYNTNDIYLIEIICTVWGNSLYYGKKGIY